MKVSFPIEISVELWANILSFTDEIEYCRHFWAVTTKSSVLKYRAVCRTFSEQCLTLLRKVKLDYYNYAISFRSARGTGDFESTENQRLVLCRLLSHPVRIEEVELVGRMGFTELEVADYEAIAACKKLRSLKISDIDTRPHLTLIGESCRRLENLSLHYIEAGGTLQPLEAFPQVKSLEYHFTSGPKQLYSNEISYTSACNFTVSDQLLAHFTEWNSLLELSGDFLKAGMGELVSSLPNLVSYKELGSLNSKSIMRHFTGCCKRKPISTTLETIELYFAAQYYEDDDDFVTILETFQNLIHIRIYHTSIALIEAKTVTALSHLMKLVTLDLQINCMFSLGNEDMVDNWLRTFLPMFPQSLKVIDFSLHSFNTSQYDLSRRIEEEIRRAIPGVQTVKCTPEADVNAIDYV